MVTSTELPTPGQFKKLLDGPAVGPPAGVTPSLDNPPNLDTISHLTYSLCVSSASLVVAIRMYTKHFLIRSITYEDCECGVFVADPTLTLTLPRRLYDWIGKEYPYPN